jgi:hypothetical protein
MTTEVRWRNPNTYFKQVLATGHHQMVWDASGLSKMAMHPIKMMELHLPPPLKWDVWIAGRQGVAAYDQDHKKVKSPYAVYPSWGYGEPLADLESLLEANVGEDDEACCDTEVPDELRPVYGQKHVVFVYGWPPLNTAPGRAFIKILRGFQEDYPLATIHVWGFEKFRWMFGVGFKSVDMKPWNSIACLPTGKEMKPEGTHRVPQWVTMFGFSPVDLTVPDNMTLYNMKSALWAADNFAKDINVSFTFRKGVDPDLPLSATTPAIATKAKLYKGTPAEGDKLLCDTCSLEPSCKYARSGGVCTVPDAEPASLATFFRTRDSDQIIDGLGILMGAATKRLERGLEDEEDSGGELNPEVTRMIDSLFEKGVKLAKLVNPALQGGTKVGVFVNGQGQAGVATGDPKKMVAGIVAELEAQGINRRDITPEMLARALGGAPLAIETAVVPKGAAP